VLLLFHDILSNSKALLRYAVLSVTESIRNNPYKYRTFFSNMPSALDYNNHQYPPYGYGFYMYRQEQRRSRDEYIAMLLEDADKLYNKLLKDLVEEGIDDYSAPNRSSLPSLPPPDEGLM
jgi:hypothetical protein